MAFVNVKVAQEWEHRVGAAWVRAVPDEHFHHRSPLCLGAPLWILSQDFGSGSDEVAVVEMVVIQGFIGAKARRIPDQRPPRLVVVEDAFRRPRSREVVLEKGFCLVESLLLGGFVVCGIGDGGERRELAERLAGPVGIGDVEFIRSRFIVYITGQARGLGDTDIRDDRKHSLKRRCSREAVAFGELYLPAAGAVGLSGERVLGAQRLMWQQTIKRFCARALHRLCRDRVARCDNRLCFVVLPHDFGVDDVIVCDGGKAGDGFRLSIGQQSD